MTVKVCAFWVLLQCLCNTVLTSKHAGMQAQSTAHDTSVLDLFLLQGSARQIHSIATHPSQPDKCASGGSNGTVAVWDLRFTSAPLVASTGKPNAGDVWQVHCCVQVSPGCLAGNV